MVKLTVVVVPLFFLAIASATATTLGQVVDVAKGVFESQLAISLGPLRQTGLLVLPAEVGSRSFGGMRIDGLLSHAFLKRYAWTLDFSQRVYIFSSGRL